MGHHRHIEVQPALRALHPFAKLLGVHYSVTRVIVWRCRMPEGYADEPMMKYDEIWFCSKHASSFNMQFVKQTEFSWAARLALLACVDLLAGRPRLRDTSCRGFCVCVCFARCMEKFCQYASTCAYDIMFIDMHECASIFILQGTKMQDKDEIQSPKEVVTPCKIPCDYLSSTTCGPNSNETSIYIYIYVHVHNIYYTHLV